MVDTICCCLPLPQRWVEGNSTYVTYSTYRGRDGEGECRKMLLKRGKLGEEEGRTVSVSACAVYRCGMYGMQFRLGGDTETVRAGRGEMW